MMSLLDSVRSGLRDLRVGGVWQKLGGQQEDLSRIRQAMDPASWKSLSSVLVSERSSVASIIRCIRDGHPTSKLQSLVGIIAGCSPKASRAIVRFSLPNIIAKLGGEVSLPQFQAIVNGVLPAGSNRHLALGVFESLPNGVNAVRPPNQLRELLGVIAKFVKAEAAHKGELETIMLGQFPQFLRYLEGPFTAQTVGAAAGILMKFPNPPSTRLLNREREWDADEWWLPQTVEALVRCKGGRINFPQLKVLAEVFNNVRQSALLEFDDALAGAIWNTALKDRANPKPVSAETLRGIGSNLLVSRNSGA